ncbi:MAG: FG-GAP-like repeat-containing protein [Planctomycetota bacterium]|nr:FG-GAP-like repeat-containing protein [Planctomycetota bacterium]
MHPALLHGALVALAALASLDPLTAQLQVLATSPGRYAPATPMGDIRVSFDQPVDPATLTDTSFSVFGRWSGVVEGALSVDAAGTTVTFRPSRTMFRGESVTVTLSEAIQATSGAALSKGYFLPFYVASAPGTGQFVADQHLPMRVPGEPRIGMYGLYSGDVDRDGSPDLVSMHEFSQDLRVLKNDGCGQFGPKTIIPNPGTWPSPSEGGDFNQDGWLDIATGDWSAGTVSVYLNDGMGNLTAPTSYFIGGSIHGVASADFNGDGYWDLACPNSNVVQILLNQGDGTFVATSSINGGGSGEDNITAIDANEDGVVDLVVGMRWSQTMSVMIGNGDGTFTMGQYSTAGGQTFSQSAGDCNGDGHVDVLFANRGTNTFALMLGDGSGTFGSPTSYAVGTRPSSIDLGDLDGDGDLDASTSNYTSSDYTIWWNRGDGVFQNPTTMPGIQSGSCTTLVDYNRDGLLDLITSDETADIAILYRQKLPAEVNSWPQLQRRSCTTTVRVDQRADLAGFANTAPAPISAGSRLEIAASGDDHAACILAFGSGIQQGVSFASSGWLHIDIMMPMATEFLFLNAFGEQALVISVPPLLSPGTTMTMQALSLNPAGLGVFSNPHKVITVP